MTMQKCATSSGTAHRNHSEYLKDEVYRQMFRLEAHRPGADRDLAVALLRAWIDLSPVSMGSSERQWLEKISPICLVMIEAAPPAVDTGRQ
ncbi:MAG: hypothetical protein P4K94_04935 [Terracidiphilus sp.]|nr:hypothetical protein [Terracidiphilus sp.]